MPPRSLSENGSPLRKNHFAPLYRSFSSNKNNYSPQTIAKSALKWISLTRTSILGQAPRLTIICCILSTFLLSACGVGGVSGDDCENPAPSKVAECNAKLKPANIDGNWFYKVNISLPSCDGLDDYENIYSVTIEQTETNLNIISPFGTFSGSINQSKLDWSGQYFDEHLQKFLTYTNVEINVENLSASGSGNLEVRDTVGGTLLCNASFILTGSAILDVGEVPVAPELVNSLSNEITDTTIKLRWIDRSINEDVFIVERSITENDGFIEVTEVVANQESFDDSGLTENTAYFYRIKARNNQGDSDFSQLLSITTNNSPLIAPDAPSNLTSNNIQASSIKLDWTDNSSNESGFIIERSDNQGESYVEVGTTATSIATFTNTGLTAVTQYTFRVFAVNSAGKSIESNIQTVTTSDQAPNTPTNLRNTSQTDISLTLQWDDTSSNEVNFIVERSNVIDSGYEVISTLGTNSTGLTDALLTSETTYFYRIKASNSAGDSDFSDTLTATTSSPPIIAPLAPAKFKVAASQTELSFELTWKDVDNESHYEVQRQTEATGVFEKIITLDANLETYTDNVLNKSTLYFYRIRATNSAGESPYTDNLNSISAHDADPVTGLIASVAEDGSNVLLNWTNPDTITSLVIQRSDDNGENYTDLGNLEPDQNSYEDTTMSLGTAYLYRVLVKNDIPSEASTTIKVTTPNVPAAPTNFSVLAETTFLSATATWTDSVNAINYVIEFDTASDGIFDNQFDINQDNESITFELPAPDTIYFVRIRARNAVGFSDYSELKAITSAQAPPKVASLALLSAADANSVDLSWSATVNTTQYRIERSLAAATGFEIIADNIFSVITYTDNSSLSPGTQYFYRLYAVNNIGDSVPIESNVTLPDRPITPTNFQLVSDPFSLKLTSTWSDVANETRYRIYYSTNKIDFKLVSAAANATQNVLTSNELLANSTYYIYITAFNAVDESDPTNTISIKTASNADAITELKATSSSTGNSVTLNWIASANALEYKIQRRVSTSTKFTTLTLGISIDGTSTSFVDSTVIKGKKYYYRVWSSNNVGNTNFATSSGVYVKNPPAAPSNVQITLKTNQLINSTIVSVTWKDNSNNEANFELHAGTGLSSIFVKYLAIKKDIANNTEAYSYTVLNSKLPTSGVLCVLVKARNNDGVTSGTRDCHTFGAIIIGPVIVAPILTPVLVK